MFRLVLFVVCRALMKGKRVASCYPTGSSAPFFAMQGQRDSARTAHLLQPYVLVLSERAHGQISRDLSQSCSCATKMVLWCRPLWMW